MTARIRSFRYVTLDHLGAWLDVGWYFDGDVMHMPHGIYGCTVEWLCTCRGPVEPLR